MREFRRAGKGVKGKAEQTNTIYYLTEKLLNDIQQIKQLSYADSIYNALDRVAVPHYEEPLFEKIALGYALATQKIEPDFVVKCTPQIEYLWNLEKEWRFKVKSGAQDSQVMQFIMAQPGITEKQLKETMLDFGMSFAETTIAIESLHRQNRIGILTDRKDKKFRERYLWPFH